MVKILFFHLFNLLFVCKHFDLNLAMKFISPFLKKNTYLPFLLYSISEIEPKYYADGEDAYAMRRDLTEFREKVKLF